MRRVNAFIPSLKVGGVVRGGGEGERERKRKRERERERDTLWRKL